MASTERGEVRDGGEVHVCSTPTIPVIRTIPTIPTIPTSRTRRTIPTTHAMSRRRPSQLHALVARIVSRVARATHAATCSALVALASATAHADVGEDTHAPAPVAVYEGHPMLTSKTKETSLDVTGYRLRDGSALGFGAGLAIAYNPWLSLSAAVSMVPAALGPRAHSETRTLLRFNLPEPVLERVVPYAGLGVTTLFSETAAHSGSFTPSFGLTAAIGAFAQLSDSMRLRLDVRGLMIVVGDADTRFAGASTLSLVTLFR